MTLGLSDEEFWRMTPKEFKMLSDRFDANRQHAELLTGILASVVANYSFSPPEKPTTPLMFMPSTWSKQKPERAPRINRKRIAMQIRGFFQGQMTGANG